MRASWVVPRERQPVRGRGRAPGTPLSARAAFCLCLGVAIGVCRGEDLTVAVAANFAPAMMRLESLFERSGHTLTVVTGSTGKLYAQIRNGAPYDLFFAADTVRPTRLASEGLAVRGSRFTYAIGRIVLWSARPGLRAVTGSGGRWLLVCRASVTYFVHEIS